MKGDFTRFTFKREKNYSGVYMQQGRVQLDADFNEEHAISQYLSQTRGTDIIGKCGVPRQAGGFKITTDGSSLNISRGRLYVDGILCDSLLDEHKTEYQKELLEKAGSVQNLKALNLLSPNANELGIDFLHQTYYPNASLPTDNNDALYLMYLDVWERHITAVEDPEIREVALGGPDTTTRSQTIWQVKYLPVSSLNEEGAPRSCWNTPTEWTDLVTKGRGLLAAKTEASENQDDPCIVPAAAGYRRLENQLYRVEVHQGGTLDNATIKWSRDNGMIVTRLLGIDTENAPRLLNVADPGKDEVLGFAAGQWIEVSDRNRELRGEPGFLVRLLHVEGQSLEIETWFTDGDKVPEELDLNADPIVRRWDHKGVNDQDLGASGGALNISELMSNDPDKEGFFELEGGVKVSLKLDGNNSEFHTGDYWLIPARAIGVNGVDGEIIWPFENNVPEFLPPKGIEHHYCRLALVDWKVQSAETEEASNLNGSYSIRHDCRPKFAELTEPDLYYISGDGQEAMPGFEDRPDNSGELKGELLPQPLRVGVSNCNLPIEGAWVMFEVTEGEGTLLPDINHPGYLELDSNKNGITAFVTATDAGGEVSTGWQMQYLKDEGEDPSQLVRATLLRERPEDPKVSPSQDISEYVMGIPVMFGASFAVAWENRYSGARFPYPHIKENPLLAASGEAVEARTVEDALDQLRENLSLFYVNGDSQEAKPQPRPDKTDTKPEELSFVELENPLQVRVANGNWPYSGASVQFKVVKGDGLLKDEDGNWLTEVILKTDNEGIATCHWQLDEWLWSQQVEARLVLDIPDYKEGKSSPVISDAVIRFNANLSVAEEVAYDGSRFPDLQHEGLIINDVEQTLDQLRENLSLFYVNGDGQEAKPVSRIDVPEGENLEPFIPLNKPLQVRVANGNWPFSGATVQFTVVDGEGLLHDGSGNWLNQIQVITDDQGIATCFWKLDHSQWGQQVEARLITLPGQDSTQTLPLISDAVIRFNANLSLASEVAYDGSVFPDETHNGLIVHDVEAALDQLRENIALHYVGGDGQEAKRGDQLPQPLQVRVANGQWARPGVWVKFEAQVDELEGRGLLVDALNNQATVLEVITDENGIAQCHWIPDGGSVYSQKVIATLVRADDEPPLQSVEGSSGEIHFSANLSIAEQVSYTPNPQSEPPQKPDDVQAALDELYTHKVNRSGDTITGSLVINQDLTVHGTTTTINTSELVIEDNIIRVNKGADGPFKDTSGLEVFRGDALPPAQVIWDEINSQWKIGLEGQLVDVAYGPNWLTLTEDKIADGLHRHSVLYADDITGVPAAQVDATGNLGIGTATPKARLHVKGNLRLDIGEGLEMLGNNNYFGSSLDARILRMIDVNGTNGEVDGGIAIEGFTPTDDTSKHIMSVRGNGNVGFGIKNPQGLIHASCQGNAGGAYNWVAPTDTDEAENTFPGIPGVNKLTITNNGGNGLAHLHGATGSVTVFIELRNANNGQWTTVFTRTLVALTTGSLSQVVFDGTVLSFPEQDVDGIRLRSSLVQGQTFHGWGGMLFSFSCNRTAGLFDGVVGIRKANPLFELDVNGIINASDIYKNGQPLSQLTPWNIGTNSISYNIGNVGVGTTTPSEKFTLRDGFALFEQGDVDTMGIKFNGAAAKTAPILRFHNPDSTINPYVWWSPRDGSLLSIEGANVDGNIGTTYLRVTETGEVGIGTNTPSAGLVVSGSGNIAGIARSAMAIENTTANMQWLMEAGDQGNFNLFNESGAALTALSVTPNGNLGIGTNSAETPLEIRRDVAGTLGPVLGLNNQAGGAGASAAIHFGVDTDGLTGTTQPNAQISAVNSDGIGNFTDMVFSAQSGGTNVEYMRFGGAGSEVSMTQPLTVERFTAFDVSIDRGQILNLAVDLLDVNQAKTKNLESFTVNADIVSANVRRFVIAHPDNPARNLIHASLDGPEHAVFYRGEALLVNGVAVVALPPYFEASTLLKGRTVQLTAKGATPFVLSASEISAGTFTVTGTELNGAFYWEVKAVRSDVPALDPEPVI